MIVQITNDWQNLNTLSGIANDKKIAVQSHSSSRIYLAQGDTAPTDSYNGAELEHGNWYLLTAKTTWVRVDSTAGSIYLEVQ